MLYICGMRSGIRGDNADLAQWDEFLGVFLDHLFSQELRESLFEEFMNVKQGRMTVKEYA